ncbi:MAG: hypothetical protein V5A81_07750 [Candidatus Bipolaricaulota bacterium]
MVAGNKTNIRIFKLLLFTKKVLARNHKKMFRIISAIRLGPTTYPGTAKVPAFGQDGQKKSS